MLYAHIIIKFNTFLFIKSYHNFTRLILQFPNPDPDKMQSSPNSDSESTPFINVEIPLDAVDDKLEINSPFHQKIMEILTRIRPEWAKKHSGNQVGIEIYTNGITNKIFRVDCGDGQRMVFRVYGAKSEMIIDRESELGTFERLRRFGLGPPVLARFQNGFVCGFLPGHCLDMQSVRTPKIVDNICRTLVRMHKIPLNPEHECSPIFRTKCEEWLVKLPSKFGSPQIQLEFDQYFEEFDLAHQFSQLQTMLDTIQSPLVFSHNDLLIYNILFDENGKGNGGQVHFIDYEYAGPNYQLFDLANHFCEYAGVEDRPDYQRNAATEEERRHFLSRYFAHFRGSELAEPEMAQLLRNVRHFEAASHFFWTLWAIHQAAISSIAFDYMQYGITRHCQFSKIFSELISANTDNE